MIDFQFVSWARARSGGRPQTLVLEARQGTQHNDLHSPIFFRKCFAMPPCLEARCGTRCPFPWLHTRTNGCFVAWSEKETFARSKSWSLQRKTRHALCQRRACIRNYIFMPEALSMPTNALTGHVLFVFSKCVSMVWSLCCFCIVKIYTRPNGLLLYFTNSASPALGAIPLPLGGLGLLLPPAFATLVATGLLTHFSAAPSRTIQAPSSVS